MSDVFKNIRGTTRDVFKIGTNGSNIFVRDTPPSTLEGFNGDWCLINGTYPTILKKLNSEWIDVSAHNLIPITGNYTYTPVSPNDVIMCNNSAAITVTVSAVPPKGHTFIIKDSNGNASQHQVTINFTNGITLDGGTSIVINSDYTTLTILSDGTYLYLI